MAPLNHSVINYCRFSYYLLCCFLFSVPVKQRENHRLVYISFGVPSSWRRLVFHWFRGAGRGVANRERLAMEILEHNTNNVIILWASHPRSGAAEEALNLANKSELEPLKQHGNGNVRAFDENVKIYSRIHTQRFRRYLQSRECTYIIFYI